MFYILSLHSDARQLYLNIKNTSTNNNNKKTAKEKIFKRKW